MYGCHDTENPPRTGTPQTCENNDGPTNCNFILGYTSGMKGACASNDSGVAIGSHGYRRFMIQIHWHNNDNRSDYIDSSGVLLYYTPHLRKYNSGVLLVGDVSIALPPGQEKTKVEGICYGQCTLRMFKGPIYINGVGHHMHVLGRQQVVQLYRDRKLVTTITNETDFNGGKVLVLSTPVEVLPGDELRTLCVYNTSSKNTTTRFGWSIDEEMCVAFLEFYPADNVTAMHSSGYKSYCYSWMKLPECIMHNVLSNVPKTTLHT